MRMISEMEDPNELYQVALKSPNREICETALKKINDQEMLYQLSVYAATEPVRNKALSRLSDPALIKKLALMEDDPSFKPGFVTNIRVSATNRITDQELLRYIAFGGSKLVSQRKAAMKKFKDLKDVEKFARIESDAYAREEALSRLDDEDLKKEIRESWSKDQKSKSTFMEHQLESIRESNEKRANMDERRSQGLCPFCGVRLASNPHANADNVIIRCGNCGKRLK